MNIYDRIAHSQEHSFIALRSNGLLGLWLIGLAVLSAAVLPIILA